MPCCQSIKAFEEGPFLECLLSSQETSMQYDKNGQKKQALNQSITWRVGIAHIVLTNFLLCLMNRLSAIYANQESYIWKTVILKPKALNNTRWNNHLDILLAAILSYQRQKIVMTMPHSHINSFQQLCHLPVNLWDWRAEKSEHCAMVLSLLVHGPCCCHLLQFCQDSSNIFVGIWR